MVRTCPSSSFLCPPYPRLAKANMDPRLATANTAAAVNRSCRRLQRAPTRGGRPMTFLIRPGVPFYGRQLQARALQAWRIAADLVWARWEAVREATPENRSAAFAAYLAALDAEATAAAALADLRLSQAA